MKRAIWASAAALLLLNGTSASARIFSPDSVGWWGALSHSISNMFQSATASSSVPAGSCSPEVGFSPEGTGVALVLKTIASAKRTIRVSAYAFTSREIARALAEAKVRSVDVEVAVDAHQNLFGSGRGASAAALNILLRAGIPVRTIEAYAIHHDKTVTVDSETVQTGSFNFSAAAARRNSEDVLVLWNCPAVAQAYTAHWQNRWAQGTPYRMRGDAS
ncbi:phospholipase D family nuclease [Burkholderia sp. HI2500]|uniref:phospholipase D family nuclease n=1 Tax=Burkholderia sp. HI2500 TaxID=2015358 RepID=UPI000B7A659E|nr:phospholipase D family protein [Burkholderia sp. HI2500]OXJ06719.1 endonuclease [Burkholderia sp. HI2500]